MQQQPEMKIDSNGTKHWTLNGQYHREGGPAVERPNGKKSWFLNGKKHREGGPAIEWPNGQKEWYLHGEEFSFEDYIMELERMGLKEVAVDCLFQME